MIKKIEILSNNSQDWIREFGKKNIIHSNGKNSKGKTTVIRSILFSLGLIKTPNYVDGSHIKDLVVNLTVEIKGKIYKFSRTKTELRIFELVGGENKINKIFQINKSENIEDILEYLAIELLRVKPVLIKAALFSNYIDQQYGSHVVNRGNVGTFIKKLKFNVNEFANEYNENLRDVAILKDKKEKLNSYLKDLDLIKNHVAIKSNKISLFDIINEKETQLGELTLKIHRLNKIKDEYLKKKSLLKYFNEQFDELDLIYTDDNGNIRSLGIENFESSNKTQNIIIDQNISDIKNKIIELKNEIKLRTRNLNINSDVTNKIKNTKEAIISLNQLKVEITEEEMKTWKQAAKVTEDEIREMESISKAKMWLKIEKSVRKYLTIFSHANPVIKPFIDKMKIIKELFLDGNSKFTTYVGAIRFAISASFKFAIADFIKENKWDCPIIIDNLLQEEIDNEMRDAYLGILKDREEQLIIASLNNQSFIKNWDKVIEVGGDIFSDSALSIFYTTE